MGYAEGLEFDEGQVVIVQMGLAHLAVFAFLLELHEDEVAQEEGVGFDYKLWSASLDIVLCVGSPKVAG